MSKSKYHDGGFAPLKDPREHTQMLDDKDVSIAKLLADIAKHELYVESLGKELDDETKKNFGLREDILRLEGKAQDDFNTMRNMENQMAMMETRHEVSSSMTEKLNVEIGRLTAMIKGWDNA